MKRIFNVCMFLTVLSVSISQSVHAGWYSSVVQKATEFKSKTVNVWESSLVKRARAGSAVFSFFAGVGSLALFAYMLTQPNCLDAHSNKVPYHICKNLYSLGFSGIKSCGTGISFDHQLLSRLLGVGALGMIGAPLMSPALKEQECKKDSVQENFEDKAGTDGSCGGS